MLHAPEAIVFDQHNHAYISDTGNHRVRKVDADTGVISTVAGNGEYGFSGDGGPATEATLDAPHGIAVDARGNLYISDSYNGRVRKVTP